MNRRDHRHGTALPFLRSLPSFLLAATLLVSCTGFSSDLAVLRANSLYSGGKYNEAIALYLAGTQSNDDLVLSYNIANAFVTLGELDSAVPLYEKVIAAGSELVGAGIGSDAVDGARNGVGGSRNRNASLAASAAFNMGLAWYKREAYAQALEAFRQSLLLKAPAPEVAMAYEMALDALKEGDPATTKERARAKEGPGNEASIFGLSRKTNTDLFLPGVPEAAGSGHDH